MSIGGLVEIGYIFNQSMLYFQIANFSNPMAINTGGLFILSGIALFLIGNEAKTEQNLVEKIALMDEEGLDRSKVLYILVVLTVPLFVIEILIMKSIDFLLPSPCEYIASNVVAALALVICIYPVVYYFIVVPFLKEIKQRKKAEQHLLLTQFCVNRASESIFLVDSDAKIHYVNGIACHQLGYSEKEMLAMKVFDIDPLFDSSKWAEHWKEIKERKHFIFETVNRQNNGETFPVEIAVNLIIHRGIEYSFAFARDITERKQSEAEILKYRERLEELVKVRTSQLEEKNILLESTLASVKTLKGLLPICSSCKKIRDDKGYWSQVESYIYEHTGAEFSHSICPDCVNKLYPDLDLDMKKNTAP